MDSLLRHDISVRIVSVLLALLIWFQVMGSVQEVQRAISGVPVRVRNLAAGLVVQSVEPETVTVYVRGAGRDVSGLSRDEFEAWIDLTGAAPGRVAFTVDRVLAPRGVALVDSEPSQVVITVADVVSKRMAVQASIQGKVAAGLQLGAVTLDPSLVTVRGSRPAVERVVQVVARADVEGATGSRRLTVEPVALDASGAPVEGVEVDPGRVVLSIEVAGSNSGA